MNQQLEIREQRHGLAMIRVVVVEDQAGAPKGVYVISTPIRSATSWGRPSLSHDEEPVIILESTPAPPSSSVKRSLLGLCAWTVEASDRVKSGFGLTRQHAEGLAERWVDQQRWISSGIGLLASAAA